MVAEEATMRIHHWIRFAQRLGFTAILAAGSVFSQPFHVSNDQQQAQFLLTAEITRVKGSPGGITNSSRVTMSDGATTHDAHLQTIDEYARTRQIGGQTRLNFIDSWKGNVAAYKLDRMIGLNMAPVTVQRRIGGKTTAVTWWVDHVAMTEEQRIKKHANPPDVARWNRQMDRMRVFDELIGNTDRNQGNILILDDWTVALIDHTRAFDYTPNLINPAKLTRCDRSLLEGIKRLDAARLRAELSPLLNGIQLESIIARRDKLVAHIEKLISEKGAAAVLYDEPVLAITAAK